MSDAQMGLIVVTPVIIVFPVALRCVGVLAVAASVAIATALVLTQ